VGVWCVPSATHVPGIYIEEELLASVCDDIFFKSP
jgi:hypothetical protein